MMSNEKKIVGVFENEQEAVNAIQSLKSHGYTASEISVVANNKEDYAALEADTGTMAPDGVVAGVAAGSILGGVTGLLAGIGALAIPGIGPIVAAGPIAAVLTGAAVGAGAGTLVGGLVGLGIPEEEALIYDGYVNEGSILVLVDADAERSKHIYDTFRVNNSRNPAAYTYEDNALYGVHDHIIK